MQLQLLLLLVVVSIAMSTHILRSHNINQSQHIHTYTWEQENCKRRNKQQRKMGGQVIYTICAAFISIHAFIINIKQSNSFRHAQERLNKKERYPLKSDEESHKDEALICIREWGKNKRTKLLGECRHIWQNNDVQYLVKLYFQLNLIIFLNTPTLTLSISRMIIQWQSIYNYMNTFYACR